MLNIKITTLLALIVGTLITIMGVMTVYYVDRYQSVQQHGKKQLIQQAFAQLSFNQREYINTRDQFTSVIQLLARSQNLHNYAEHPIKANKSLLESIWSSVLSNQKMFSAVRFATSDGQERIRIDYSIEYKQYKVATHYFDHLSQQLINELELLSHDDVYIQPMNLGITGRGVDRINPVFSLIAPVVFEGKNYGYLIVDVELLHLLSALNYSPYAEYQPSLLDRQGFYLDSPQKELRFGNLIPSREQYNFSLMFPQTWALMQSQSSGALSENGKLTIFSKVSLSVEQQYYLLIAFSEDELNHQAKTILSELKTEAALAYFIVILFTLPMIFFALFLHRKGIDSKLARAALDGSSAMIISDQSHRILMVNDAFEKMTSLTQRVIRGKNTLKLLLSHYGVEFILDVSERLVDNLLWEGEVELTNSLGLPITIWMRIQAVKEHGEISYYIISLMDISERKELENKLRDLSERDSLTGLWNRGRFEKELMMQCQLVERYGETHSACLAIIDIDHFKRINDTYGHDRGDVVIMGVSRILTDFSRNTDFVARIGGEEYGMILPHTGLDDAAHFLERLCQRIANDSELNITVSAGVTDLSADPRRSYKCADIGLYEAKTLGRNQVSVCHNSDEIA